MDCIFCKIRDGVIPSESVYSDEKYFVIHDIHPKAKTHMLIIPKQHIATISDLKESDESLVGGMFLLARDLAKKFQIDGYQLKFHVGEKGGQEVMHIHLHFLSDM